jgi:hypothetical protein
MSPLLSEQATVLAATLPARIANTAQSYSHSMLRRSPLKAVAITMRDKLLRCQTAALAIWRYNALGPAGWVPNG